MIFGGRILFIFCALIFALHFSILNAYYLNNNGHGNVTVPENYMKDEECFECVGYKCKLNNDEIIEGKDCLKNVVKFCGISKSDVSVLKSVVQNHVYSNKSDKHLIYSCQYSKNANDKMEDQMNVKIDQRREKRDDKDDEACEGLLHGKPSENADVAEKREYVVHFTKCVFEYLVRNSTKRIREAQNALNDVKMAAEELFKIIDDANTTANEIKKFGDYYKKEVEGIAKKVESVSTSAITAADEILKTLNDSFVEIEEKCAKLNETAKACFYTTINCTMEQYFDASTSCLKPYYIADYKTTDYLSKANELMKPINELKPEIEKVFMEANVALTAENAQELAEKSKEIGENSNKTANFAVEIGIEAKMAANESIKIGNEANQKLLEVEKMAKDSLKLAKTNQKAGDKTENEIRKLKSNAGKNGCKFGIFGISLFAYIFLY